MSLDAASRAAVDALKARVAALAPQAFGRVAVLMGGDSAEREVSLNSGANVLEALRSRGVDAHAVDGVSALLAALARGERFDRVFNILHGGAGENGVLQGALEALGLPYTGPGVLGSALTMDKIRTKQVWMAEGLPTAGFVRIPPGGDLTAAVRSLGLPVFVKPSTEGSSVGVFRIVDEAGLAPAIDFARTYPGELLAEQMITGGEFTVGILGVSPCRRCASCRRASGTTTTRSTSATTRSTTAPDSPATTKPRSARWRSPASVPPDAPAGAAST